MIWNFEIILTKAIVLTPKACAKPAASFRREDNKSEFVSKMLQHHLIKDSPLNHSYCE
jgi:hypothetical protein